MTPSRGSGRASATVSLLLSLLSAAPAVGLFARVVCAEPPAENSKPIVRVVLAGADASAEAALSSVWNSLQQLHVDLVFDRVAAFDAHDVAAGERSAAAVVVWLDLQTPRVAKVYVTEGENVFARRLQIAPGLDAVALDLLDVVLTSSVQTALSGQKLGISRAEFRRSLERPAPHASAMAARTKPAAPSEPAIALSVAGFYEGSWLGRGKISSGPGLLIQGLRGPLRLGIDLQGQIPYEVSGAGATVRIAPEMFGVFAGWSLVLAPNTALVIAFGASAEVKHVRATPTEPGIQAAAAFVATDPLLRPWLGLEQRSGHWLIGARAGVDVDLFESDYTVRAGSDAQTVWASYRVRPAAGLFAGLVL